MSEQKTTVTLNCGWIIWVPFLTLIVWAIGNFFGGLPILLCILIAFVLYLLIGR